MKNNTQRNTTPETNRATKGDHGQKTHKEENRINTNIKKAGDLLIDGTQ
jgi:hypothetical protein